MKKQIILVIGAAGQIGTELTATLRQEYGRENVIAADKKIQSDFGGIELDVLDTMKLRQVILDLEVTQIYLLAAMLSATGEQHPGTAWKLNVQSLLSILEIAKEFELDRVFWPSSIAVFGPGSPKYNCPQQTRIEPNTVYGISKRAGEHWCQYYFEKFGVDVRSLRFPGLISYSTPPGGGTTDYAIEIFHHALENQSYNCFLTEDNCLPMMYMPDAIRAIMELMNAPKEKIGIRTSYNIAGMSFAPCDIAAAIRVHIPEFKVIYEPDFRNSIANSWPASIKDDQARKDWNWKPEYGLKAMTKDMLQQLSNNKRISISKEVIPYPDFHINTYNQL
ncbi:NAD-dependent epimerase/dehydratase family protein [Mucilaginibacter sp. L196]|uniref:NAD-dependent epimerase/dehydratase family protein n=1 Tax=Mucilaginibacter sp. L196 TaxID=1641870 RepID=UPI00131E6DB8|nr:NAD-dependent epimerase/dehydratase family protein [Mucilaginibacter sp. L196]